MPRGGAGASIGGSSVVFPEGESLARFTDFLDTQRRLATLDQLLKHVEGAPGDPRVRLRLGDVLQGLERIDEAVVQYREAAFLLSKRGFDKQARAVRALILSLLPGDQATLRDLKFESNLELARTQVPLPREDKAIGPDDEFSGDIDASAQPKMLMLPGTIESRDTRRAVSDAPWSAPTTKFSENELSAAVDGGITVDVATPETRTGSRAVDRRIDPRAHAEGVVRIFGSHAQATGFLEDVSERGIFVSGPRIFREGSLVDVALQLPEARWIGLARAKVMRSVDASRRRAAGLGLAFLWMDSPTERWIEDFVTAVFGADAHRRNARFLADGGKRDEDIRRTHPRGEIDLPAVLRGPEVEVAGWVRDLSLGGAFVEGPRVYGPGRRVDLLLWMPGRYSPVVVESVVAHDSKPPANGYGRGTGVRFIKMSDALEIELRQLLD